MPDAKGFMVAAYVLTVFTVVAYGIRLVALAHAMRRRLESARALYGGPHE